MLHNHLNPLIQSSLNQALNQAFAVDLRYSIAQTYHDFTDVIDQPANKYAISCIDCSTAIDINLANDITLNSMLCKSCCNVNITNRHYRNAIQIISELSALQRSNL